MLRSSLVLLTALILAACGGGGGDKVTTSPPNSSGGTVTEERAAVNAARLVQLTELRNQCGGNVLPDVMSDDRLITSAVKHAGWQALWNQKNHTAELNHYPE